MEIRSNKGMPKIIAGWRSEWLRGITTEDEYKSRVKNYLKEQTEKLRRMKNEVNEPG